LPVAKTKKNRTFFEGAVLKPDQCLANAAYISPHLHLVWTIIISWRMLVEKLFNMVDVFAKIKTPL
jgi:hypothetical protein